MTRRTPTPTSARRLLPRVTIALLAVLTALLPAQPGYAAGTGGIEVTPLPAIVDGEQATAFHLDLPGRGSKDVSFLLRNVESGERTATVYTAAVTKLPGGGYDVGPAGSSPYVSYRKQSVTLGTGDQRVDRIRVSRPAGDRPAGTVYAALVVEVSNGSVVQRAATLIYLEEAPLLPVHLAVIIAITLILLLGLAVPLAARRRSAADARAADARAADAEKTEAPAAEALVGASA